MESGKKNFEGYEKREKESIKKSRKNIICGIVQSILEKRVLELSEDEQWVTRKSLEYMKKPYARYPSEKIFKLFKEYKEAQNKKEKIGYWKLGKRCGFYRTTVRRLFKLGELSSLSGRNSKKVILGWKEQAIKRAATLKLSCLDIGYFLRVPEKAFVQRFCYQNLKKSRDYSGIKRFYIGRRLRVGDLNYRLASQIYEARDAGFSKKKTLELLDTLPEVVKYALEHEREISSKIIHNLKILFPKARINKPYVDFNLNKYAESLSK